MAELDPSENFCDYPVCGKSCVEVCPKISADMRRIDMSHTDKRHIRLENECSYNGTPFYDLDHYPMD